MATDNGDLKDQHSLSDSDMAEVAHSVASWNPETGKVEKSKQDHWDREAPRIPEADMLKVATIIQKLMERFYRRIVQSDNAVSVWAEIQDRAHEQFDKIGLNVRVRIIIVGINLITFKQETLKVATLTNPRGYAIQDGEFRIPNSFEAKIIHPEIIIYDWDTLDKKKEKAEESIEESEQRRREGKTYHPTLSQLMR